MARAGAAVAHLHDVVREAAVPGVTTAELDAIAERELRNRGAAPSFKGYRVGRDVPAFPATLCTSVNEQVVHGIPSANVVLRAGDVLKVDAGAYVDGYHADAAVTWVVGGQSSPAVERLVNDTRAALWDGIRTVRDGSRLSDIGAAIADRGHHAGYGVITEYAGHGVGRSLHEDPPVANTGPAGRGPVLRPGIALAIEPMFTLGSENTTLDGDGWTIATSDGSTAAHWEHTVAVTDDGPWVLTARSDEPAWPDQHPQMFGLNYAR